MPRNPQHLEADAAPGVDDPSRASMTTAPGTVTIAAATAADALAEVHERFGPYAAIVDARRQLRGGIAGFFCKETFEVDVATRNSRRPSSRAEPPQPAPTGNAPFRMPRPATFTPARLPSVTDAPGTSGVTDLLQGGEARQQRHAVSPQPSAATPPGTFERLLQQAEAADTLTLQHATTTAPMATESTGAVLTKPAMSMTDAATTMAAPEVPVQEQNSPEHTSPEHISPERAPTISLNTRNLVPWSGRTLVRLGVSPGFVNSLELDDSATDAAWTEAIERAVAALCRPLPSGRFVIVGPEACKFGAALGAPTGRSPAFASAMVSSRWAHLVVGGVGWRPALQFEPLAVSWVTPRDLPEALRCATDLGMVLGYCITGGKVRRATPRLVAQQLRDVVAGCTLDKERW